MADELTFTDSLGYRRWSASSCRRCGYRREDCTCIGGYVAPEATQKAPSLSMETWRDDIRAANIAQTIKDPTIAATERVSRALVAWAKEVAGRGVDVRDITQNALVETLSRALRNK